MVLAETIVLYVVCVVLPLNLQNQKTSQTILEYECWGFLKDGLLERLPDFTARDVFIHFIYGSTLRYR